MKDVVNVKLNNVEDVENFVNICNHFEEIDIDYIIGRYSFDAKSIMGILSTSLGQTAKVKVYKADQNMINDFCNVISKWIAEE